MGVCSICENTSSKLKKLRDGNLVCKECLKKARTPLCWLIYTKDDIIKLIENYKYVE